MVEVETCYTVTTDWLLTTDKIHSPETPKIVSWTSNSDAMSFDMLILFFVQFNLLLLLDSM